MNIPTPHIEVKEKGIIAKTVLMPGDPLRAKLIAENYLEDVIQFNSVRNIFGYTGTYKGKELSVMGSGMGMPSIGIYSYELFKFYDVQNIIRIGSCGAYSSELNLYDVVLGEKAYSESTYAKTFCGYEKELIESSETLNRVIKEKAKDLNIHLACGCIHTSDVFTPYLKNIDDYKIARDKFNCIAAEMEAFALYTNAKELGKNTTCLISVSDSMVKNEVATSEERQNAFTNMMKIALESAILL